MSPAIINTRQNSMDEPIMGWALQRTALVAVSLPESAKCCPLLAWHLLHRQGSAATITTIRRRRGRKLYCR